MHVSEGIMEAFIKRQYANMAASLLDAKKKKKVKLLAARNKKKELLFKGVDATHRT